MEWFMTRFVRRDGKPNEEYYYRSGEEAINHLDFFRDDGSGLYSRIEVINLKKMELTAILEP